MGRRQIRFGSLAGLCWALILGAASAGFGSPSTARADDPAPPPPQASPLPSEAPAAPPAPVLPASAPADVAPPPVEPPVPVAPPAPVAPAPGPDAAPVPAAPVVPDPKSDAVAPGAGPVLTPAAPPAPPAPAAAKPAPAPAIVIPFAPAPTPIPTEPCCVSRRWTLLVEGGVSMLSDLERRLGAGVPPGTPELGWNRVDYDPSIAGRIGVDVDLDGCNSVEAGFAWYGSFHSSGSRPTGAFGFAPPPGGVSPQLSATFDAKAEAYGARAAWWHGVSSSRCTTVDVGLGARWIRLREQGDVTDWQPAVAAAPSLRGVSTDDVVAALLCARVSHHLTDCWTIGASGEVFGGWMRREINVSDTAVLSAGDHTSTLKTDDFSWGFEAQASASYAITGELAIRASIGVLYLAEVNRIDTVFDFNRAATGVVQARDDGRDAVLPYAFVGFEFTF